MDSPNFAFLLAHDDRLVTLGSLAERYFHDDPSMTTVRLRQFAELMAKLIAARHAAYQDERESCDERLRRLSYDRLIPREIADIFHALRKTGKAAVHEAGDDHAIALTALKFAWSLSIWFHRTYGRAANFVPGEFIPPPDAVQENLQRDASDRAALELRVRESEATITAKIAGLQVEAEAGPRAEAVALIARGKKAAVKIRLDEAETRALIDQQLRDRGWDVDTTRLRHSAGVRPAKGRNMAIAEWPTASGPADYALFVGTTLIGVVEAKRQRKNISAAIDQAERYAAGFKAGADFAFAGGPWGDYRVPFVFAANGRSYLKRIETESGIWFRDTRRAANLRRALVDWPTPDGLSAWLEIDREAADAALTAQPFAFGFPLRPYQESAIRAVEKALSADRRAMLVAMATGTGKTKLAIALLYRLLSAKRFRRICFVVDRNTLGDQTEGEFSTTKVVSGKSFAEIFGLKGLSDGTPDVETRVHICTIQGLVKRVLFAADTSEAPPVDQYDLMVIDECHRGYLLDRDISDAGPGFRGQDDYISKYRRVLDHFDAVKIGLTATPALHTTRIFGDPIFTYSYREAVIDGFLIDHEPPIRIATALAKAGITFEKDEALPLLNTRTGEIDLAHAPDEVRFEVESFNKQVITSEFNRVVAEELARHIDPALPGKTLIFAATDAHADIVVDQVKQAFAHAYGEIDDAAVKKITGSVDKVKTLIRSFRNDANPQIAVTVDLLATGIDVPKITNLVFLRRVNSRILYEQMIGRATRRSDDIGKEVFRIFDAVDLYPHLQNLTEMRPVVANPSIRFAQLVREMVEATGEKQRKTVREQFAVMLRRRLNRLSPEARERFEAVAGETPEAMLRRLLSGDAPGLAAWLKDRAAIGPILDWQADGNDPRHIPISYHEDEVLGVTRGYGTAEQPEDFLDGFTAFVRGNGNRIAALRRVVQCPRDLTRGDLRALRLELDKAGYADAALRRAWAEAKKEDIAASTIGFVRQAALGDSLIAHEDRVRAAMRAILAGRSWTDPQKRWLGRIGEQAIKEIIVDREAIDKEPFIADGGFHRLNRIFGGELENILAGINEEMWKKTA